MYRLEWYHECGNTRCYDRACQLCQGCRHTCGSGPMTVQPPPVIPYGDFNEAHCLAVADLAESIPQQQWSSATPITVATCCMRIS